MKRIKFIVAMAPQHEVTIPKKTPDEVAGVLELLPTGATRLLSEKEMDRFMERLGVHGALLLIKDTPYAALYDERCLVDLDGDMLLLGSMVVFCKGTNCYDGMTRAEAVEARVELSKLMVMLCADGHDVPAFRLA